MIRRRRSRTWKTRRGRVRRNTSRTWSISRALPIKLKADLCWCKVATIKEAPQIWIRPKLSRSMWKS